MSFVYSGLRFNVKAVAASLRRQGLRAAPTRRFRPVGYRKHGLLGLRESAEAGLLRQRRIP